MKVSVFNISFLQTLLYIMFEIQRNECFTKSKYLDCKNVSNFHDLRIFVNIAEIEAYGKKYKRYSYSFFYLIMGKKIKNVYMKLKKIMFAECKDNTYGLELSLIHI